MANRRIEMFEYRHVIHNMRQGLSDRAIAKAGGLGRGECAFIRSIAEEQGWLTDGPLPEEEKIAAIVRERMSPRPVQASISEPYDEHIRRWVEQGVQGTTIYQALVDQFGFTGSYSSVRRRVRTLRSTAPRTTCMLAFAPVEAAQVDFGKGPLITDTRSGKVIRSWIFVITLCYSRHMYAEIVGDQHLETWLVCHRRAFSFFGGVVKKIILDISDMCIFLDMAKSGRFFLFGQEDFRINPISGKDVAGKSIDAIDLDDQELSFGGPVIFTCQEIAHEAFAALGTKPKSMALRAANVRGRQQWTTIF